MKAKILFALLMPVLLHSARAEPVHYAVEPTHTFVYWEARHFGVSTSRGRFERVSGHVILDTRGKTGTADIAIDMNSISTGVAPFDAHLRRDDYSDVERHPTARFVGSDFRFDGDQLQEVRGRLTLRGITHPITLRAKRFSCYDNPFLKREVCGGDFEASVVRSRYGMVHGLPSIVPDDAISLQIQIEAVRQPSPE